MSPSRRPLLVLAAVALLAAGITMVVLGGANRGRASSMDASSLSGVGEPTSAASSQAPAIDPAKEEPVLDKFVSKDPFRTFEDASASPTPTPTSTASPTPTPTSTAPNPVSAKVEVSGTASTVREGSTVPTSDPALTVSSITAAGVTFTLRDNQHFDDGSSSVQVAEGQVVEVASADTGASYRLDVIALNYSGTDTSGQDGNGTSAGHSITLLSINTQNGSSSATFRVDGKTYADKKTGAAFSTGYGQIKVLVVSAGAQTVTILHGDATIVLHVGEKVEK